MRKSLRLATLCVALFIVLCFSSIVLYAAPEDENTGSTIETTAPAESEITTLSEDTVIPPGTGTVVDVFTGEDGKKFYTIQTPEGNTFYLVLDFTKQSENVYFLDSVTEKDLLALAEKEGSNQISDINNGNTNKNTISEPPVTKQPDVQPDSNNSNPFSMVIVVLVVLAGGGAGIYFKLIKKKRNTDNRQEFEAEEDYEEAVPDYDEYVEEAEDDTPPWEDDNV